MRDTSVIYLDLGKLNLEGMILTGIKPNQVLIETHQASVYGSELTRNIDCSAIKKGVSNCKLKPG